MEVIHNKNNETHEKKNIQIEQAGEKNFHEVYLKSIKRVVRSFLIFKNRISLLFFCCIAIYLVWAFFSVFIQAYISGLSGLTSLAMTVLAAILSGLVLLGESLMLAIVQTSFNRMINEINHSGLEDNERDNLTSQVITINEIFKVVVNKFLLFQFIKDLASVCIRGESLINYSKNGHFAYLLYFIYLIPVGYIFYITWRVNRIFANLLEIEKNSKKNTNKEEKEEVNEVLDRVN